MDATPGGKDEIKVLASLRRGQEVDVGDRVLLLMSTITLTIYNFVSQVRSYILSQKSCSVKMSRIVSHVIVGAPLDIFSQQHVGWSLTQGLFERHKLVMATQLCMAVLQKAGKLQQVKYNYLVRGLRKDNILNAVKEWLPDTTWFAAAALAVKPYTP